MKPKKARATSKMEISKLALARVCAYSIILSMVK